MGFDNEKIEIICTRFPPLDFMLESFGKGGEGRRWSWQNWNTTTKPADRWFKITMANEEDATFFLLMWGQYCIE